MYQTIKQLEEKNVAQEIEILVWSDRMDLVAFSNIKGEVALHRLTWARAWNIAPHKDGIKVKAMTWRSDSKVIAIAYSTGEVLLINVENKNVLHKIEINGDITCLSWVQGKKENKTGLNLLEEEEIKDKVKYADNSSTFLAELQPISTSITHQSEEKINLCQNQHDMNLLVIGTKEGTLHLSIFGKFTCAVLNLSKLVGYKCSIVTATFSDDLGMMFVTVRNDYDYIRIIALDTEIFKSHKQELLAIANKHSHLDSLLSYLPNTIAAIKETWETILLEMDTKLKKYASKVPEGTLTADFLDLLMFGITSLEMQEFLLQDLTEKGLKKFGQVIESSYANIQKLLLKNLIKVGQNITYHLAELRGMARLKTRFELVGLSEDLIMEAINLNGSFLSKGGEMHQLINHSMINYKAFFRWLYTAIVHLMEEQIPPEMPKMTQQDVSHITDFILNFDHIGKGVEENTSSSKQAGFTMERLGQYLEDAPLTVPVNIEESIWQNFLMHNECIRDHPEIIKRYPNNSLVQQFHMLQDSIKTIFERPSSLISEKVKIQCSIDCLRLDGEDIRISEINSSDNSIYIGMIDRRAPGSGIYLSELTTDSKLISGRSVYIYFSQLPSIKSEGGNEHHQVIDFKFYSVNILSVLLQESSTKPGSILYQFPLNLVREKMIPLDVERGLFRTNVPKVNAVEFTPATMKCLEDMPCTTFAVSGPRKVCIVLSKNRKKVRLFEMEADEEEEEDADMTSSMVENDTIS